jgi:hypothetical protein
MKVVIKHSSSKRWARRVSKIKSRQAYRRKRRTKKGTKH